MIFYLMIILIRPETFTTMILILKFFKESKSLSLKFKFALLLKVIIISTIQWIIYSLTILKNLKKIPSTKTNINKTKIQRKFPKSIFTRISRKTLTISCMRKATGTKKYSNKVKIPIFRIEISYL